jgi:Acetyltransferase (GNAT) domain
LVFRATFGLLCAASASIDAPRGVVHARAVLAKVPQDSESSGYQYYRFKELGHFFETAERVTKRQGADLNRTRRTLRATWKGGEDHDIEASLDPFFLIYSQALDLLDADDFYRFPRSYFSHLAALGHHLGIAFVWLGDELVGGNLFLSGPNYAHRHLADANETGRKYGASTLLLVEGSQWARERGCELLHLGGGMSPGDRLEDFKRSFR